MKIKIIRYEFDKNSKYCYECGRDDSFLALGTTDWEEVDEERYFILSNAVNDANNLSYNNKKYQYILFQESNFDEILKTSKQFLQEEKDRKLKYEQKQKIDTEHREKQKLERKQKQLKKLKRELEGKKHKCDWSKETLDTMICKICDKIISNRDYFTGKNL